MTDTEKKNAIKKMLPTINPIDVDYDVETYRAIQKAYVRYVHSIRRAIGYDGRLD